MNLRRTALTTAVVLTLGLLAAPAFGAPKGGRGFGRGNIPPQVAERVGISPELQQRVRQLAFEANEQLINLDAENKRARLELEKALAQERPDARAVMGLIDRVAKAEAEVRKNRVGLMLKVREALGPELWRKLQAEMPERRGRR
jgi:Spy/CpxP family protein refolding chaperone